MCCCLESWWLSLWICFLHLHFRFFGASDSDLYLVLQNHQVKVYAPSKLLSRGSSQDAEAKITTDLKTLQQPQQERQAPHCPRGSDGELFLRILISVYFQNQFSSSRTWCAGSHTLWPQLQRLQGWRPPVRYKYLIKSAIWQNANPIRFPTLCLPSPQSWPRPRCVQTPSSTSGSTRSSGELCWEQLDLGETQAARPTRAYHSHPSILGLNCILSIISIISI